MHAYDATGHDDYSEAMSVTTVTTTGLNVHPTFDSSITGNSNAAAIEAMINRAIAIYESLFSDPVTIQIRFRYSTTLPTAPLFRRELRVQFGVWSTRCSVEHVYQRLESGWKDQQ